MLAELSATEAEARLVLDWAEPLRRRPSTRPSTGLRSCGRTGLSRLRGYRPSSSFPQPRHTYASLCAAAGIDVRDVAAFMGHGNTTTTENIYTHLFNTDDHSGAMAALGALATGPTPSTATM